MLVVFIFIALLAIQFGVIYFIEKKQGNKLNSKFYYILGGQAVVMFIAAVLISTIIEINCVTLSDETVVDTYLIKLDEVESISDEDDESITIVLKNGEEVEVNKTEEYDSENGYTIEVCEYTKSRLDRGAKAFWLYNYFAFVEQEEVFEIYYVS